MAKQTERGKAPAQAPGVVEPSPAQSGTPEDGETVEMRDEVREEIKDHVKNGNDAAEIAIEAVDELAGQAGELEGLRQELEGTKEQLLRKAAEFQNYRRRTEQEKGGLVEFGQSLVVQRLLDVVDDFQRSLEAAEQIESQEAEIGAAYASLKQGVDLVYRKLMDELKKLGVEPIEAVGQPFNEAEHEAMMQQPGPEDTPAGVVLQELQRGYRMGDRVLRHSKVIVSA